MAKKHRVLKMTQYLRGYSVGELVKMDDWYKVMAKSDKHLVLKAI